MAKITLANVLSGFSLTRINDNFKKIEDTLNNEVLYKEGGTLSGSIDANGYRVLNTPVTLTAPNGVVYKLVVGNTGIVSVTPL